MKYVLSIIVSLTTAAFSAEVCNVQVENIFSSGSEKELASALVAKISEKGLTKVNQQDIEEIVGRFIGTGQVMSEATREYCAKLNYLLKTGTLPIPAAMLANYFPKVEQILRDSLLVRFNGKRFQDSLSASNFDLYRVKTLDGKEFTAYHQGFETIDDELHAIFFREGKIEKIPYRRLNLADMEINFYYCKHFNEFDTVNVMWQKKNGQYGNMEGKIVHKDRNRGILKIQKADGSIETLKWKEIRYVRGKSMNTLGDPGAQAIINENVQWMNQNPFAIGEGPYFVSIDNSGRIKNVATAMDPALEAKYPYYLQIQFHSDGLVSYDFLVSFAGMFNHGKLIPRELRRRVSQSFTKLTEN